MSGSVQPAPSSTDITGQILCGYQGWFAYPGDGAPINKWRHWFNNGNGPTLEHLSVEMYPSIDEYDAADLKTSKILKIENPYIKSYAKFYSASRPKVVLKHFEWMERYGIAGVFHHRFMAGLGDDNNREWKTMVLRNVRDAAEATDRVFAVGYDIAGQDDRVLDGMKEDWMRLVDEERITRSHRYLHHNGLPVLHIYGIGFKNINVKEATKVASFIEWMQNGPKQRYRVFLIGGVPSRWRERIVDSRETVEWKGIYDSFDGIHPWHVGRWDTIKEFKAVDRDIISEDAEYCAERGILYMPTMWPGFSWHNLMKTRNIVSPLNQVPRLGGRFMWEQAYQYAADDNINTIWMAQFDEVDEATAIFKVAKDASEAPVEGSWLTLDADGESLPNDWYLRLCGAAQKMLVGDLPLTKTIPIVPWTESPTDSPSTSARPSKAPTPQPTTARPTRSPTDSPTMSPWALNETAWLEFFLSKDPSSQPSVAPSLSTNPTSQPSAQPSMSSQPSSQPSTQPSTQPSSQPSIAPSTTRMPSRLPSASPTTSLPPSMSVAPSSQPSIGPSVSLTPTSAASWNGPSVLIAVATVWQALYFFSRL